MFTIEKKDDVFTATLTLDIASDKKSTWDMLTVNSKLKQWFNELEIEHLVVGGRVLFDMQDETFETMDILEVEDQSVLAYTWDQDKVKFILNENGENTSLTFIETINHITKHTPRDLAGWHCCMYKVKDLLEGTNNPESWDVMCLEYSKMVEKVQ